MAAEKKVTELIKETGFEPLEGRAIIVTYAPVNLSERIVRFFNNEFFVLQICRDSIVLVPFGKAFLNLKKDVALEIPVKSIHAVRVSEDMLNYRIELDTEEGMLAFSAQQKELSEFRTSGMLATGMKAPGADGGRYLRWGNWHRKNLDATLDTLKRLCC